MKLKLVEKRDEAEATKSFFFEPEHTLNYLAGQYCYFTLPKLNYPDARGTTRHFTISSSPTEGNLIRLTTRIRQESGYKKTLDELPVGSILEGEGPSGTFILTERDLSPQIFIAGGIGITPFRGIIKYSIDKGLTAPLFLIYSNSTEAQITFNKELTAWDSQQEFFRMENFITSTSGHLDATKLQNLTGKWKLDPFSATWWLCGPPPMVDALEIALAQMKIPGGRIRTEKFTGY